MVFNPIFVSRAGAEDFQEAGKQSKIASANYMFSDIIKVYLNDAPETATGLTLTGTTDKAIAAAGEVIETATIAGDEKETDAASALILSGESLQTAKLPAMQLVEFANAFLPVEAAKLNTLESVTANTATTTTSSVIKSDVQESISIQNYLPSEFNSTATVNTASANLMSMANAAGKTEAAATNANTVKVNASPAMPSLNSLEEKALQDLHAAFSELMQTAATEGKQTKPVVTESVNPAVATKFTGTATVASTATEAIPLQNKETVSANQVKAPNAPVAEEVVNTTTTGAAPKQTVTTEQVAKELGFSQVKYTAATTSTPAATRPAAVNASAPETTVKESASVEETAVTVNAEKTVTVEVNNVSAPKVNKTSDVVIEKSIAKETTVSTSTTATASTVAQSSTVKNSGTVVVEQNSTVVNTNAEAGKTTAAALPTDAQEIKSETASAVPAEVKANTQQVKPEVNDSVKNTVAVKTAEVNKISDKQVAEKPVAKENTPTVEKVVENKNSKPVDTKQAVPVEQNVEQTKTAATVETSKATVKEVYRSQPHVVKSDTPIKGIKMQTQNATNVRPEVTIKNSVVEKTTTTAKSASSTPIAPEATLKTEVNPGVKNAAVKVENATGTPQLTKTETPQTVQNEKVATQPITVKAEKMVVIEQNADIVHTDIPKASVVSTEGNESKKLDTPMVDVKQSNVAQPAKLSKNETAQTPIVADEVALPLEDNDVTVSPKVVNNVTPEPVMAKATMQKEMPAAETQKTVTVNKEVVTQEAPVTVENNITVNNNSKVTNSKELQDPVAVKVETETASTVSETVKQTAPVVTPKTESSKVVNEKTEPEAKPIAAEHNERATAPVNKETTDFTEHHKDEKESASTIAVNSKPEKENKPFVVDRPVVEKKEVKEQESSTQKAGTEYQRTVVENVKAVPAEENSTKATEAEAPAVVKEVGTPVDNRVRESVHNVTTKPANEFEAPQTAPKLVKVSDAMKEVQTIIEAKQKETMVFQLDPENMGKMKVTLTNVENILRAHIEVETESARKTLEGNMQQLLQKLESNGVQVQSVQITMQHQDQQKRQPHYSNKKQQQSYPEEQNASDHEDSVRELGYNTVEYVV